MKEKSTRKDSLQSKNIVVVTDNCPACGYPLKGDIYECPDCGLISNRLKQKNDPITHAYALWAANVLLAVFAPAFLCRHSDRKFARRPPSP
jgi:hypothetical protein